VAACHKCNIVHRDIKLESSVLEVYCSFSWVHCSTQDTLPVSHVFTVHTSQSCSTESVSIVVVQAESHVVPPQHSEDLPSKLGC